MDFGSGWFQREAWEKIVARVQSRFQALLQGETASGSSAMQATEQQTAQDYVPANRAAEQNPTDAGEQAMDSATSVQGSSSTTSVSSGGTELFYAAQVIQALTSNLKGRTQGHAGRNASLTMSVTGQKDFEHV